MANETEQLEWFRVADVDELPPGRVKTVTAGVHSMALTNIEGELTAMENRCPHRWARDPSKLATMDSAGCAAPGTVGTLTLKPVYPLGVMKIPGRRYFHWKFVMTVSLSVWRQKHHTRRP
jgi:hypothetical protein